MRRSSILYRLLYGPSVDLRDYEELLVARLESDLSQSAAWKLRKQLTILQRRRQTDDRVLLFLPDDDRGVDPGIKFRNSGDEILLASASIVGKDGGVIRAKAFAYRGVFSSLQFNKSPKALRGSKLSDFVVANDPEWIGDLIPASREWTGVVQRWADLANVQSTAAPLPLERRNRILGALDVKLPAEYLDAIDQSEGLIVGPIQISGLSSIGSNPLPEGELVTLAQTPDGVIGVVSPGGELGYQTEDGLAFPPEPFGALVAGLLPARQRPS